MLAADATAAVGTDMVAAPTGGGAAQQSICIYGPKDQSGSSQAFVFALGVVYPDQATADAVQPDQLAATYRQFAVTDAHTVPNVGDKAVEFKATSQSGGNGIAIFVFRANVLMMIAIGPTNDSNKIETLAKAAVSNLDKAPKS